MVFCAETDRPKFTQEEAEIYEEEDLNKLLAACDEEERLWYKFFLMTAMRDQEVRYCYWSDVRFAANEVRVGHKPDMGWTPKCTRNAQLQSLTSLWRM